MAEGWEVVFSCPACREQVRIWMAVPIYHLMTGPSLTCVHCGALIAVRLEVVCPRVGRLGQIRLEHRGGWPGRTEGGKDATDGEG
jgi:predicted RNA-binding Zn-ribbon protein involved in translation (DUF1610 family)